MSAAMLGGVAALSNEFERVKKPRLDPTAELIDKALGHLSKARDEVGALASAAPGAGAQAEVDHAEALRLCAIVAAAASEVEQVRTPSAYAALRPNRSAAPCLTPIAPAPICALARSRSPILVTLPARACAAGYDL
jgi:hypothetical protein